MQQNSKVQSIVIIAAAALVLAGCSSTGADGSTPVGSDGTEAKTVTISDVGWRYSNIDPAFWTGSESPTGSAFVSFYLFLEETDLLDADIDGTVLSSQGQTWTRTADEIELDEENDVVPLRHNWSDSTEATIPLSPWEITVELANGATDSVTSELSPPDTTAVDQSKTHVYAPKEYTGDPTGRVAMIPRATGLSGSWSGATDISISFDVDDARVYNGWVWFYDADGEYIAMSKSLADWSDGTPNPAFFSGAFDKSGVTNTIEIPDSKVEMVLSTATFADIAKAVIVLTDGAQYTQSGAYDFRSITAPFDVTGGN